MQAPRLNSKKQVKIIPKPTFFGQNLKFLRRMKGLSQSELGKQIGLSRNNIASYETGVVEPNMKVFLRACTFFETEPSEMLETILSDHPSDLSFIDDKANNIVDKYLNDQVEQFVIQTNEMTKIFDGYSTFFEMKKDSEDYKTNRELYSTLEDLLELLQSLIHSNWQMIQSVFPNEEEE